LGLTRAFVELSGVFFPAELREDKLIVRNGGGLSCKQAKQSLEKIRIAQDNDLRWTGINTIKDSRGQSHKALFLDVGKPVLIEFAGDVKPRLSWLARLFLHLKHLKQ
jgi:hypothetical protein